MLHRFDHEGCTVKYNDGPSNLMNGHTVYNHVQHVQ